MNVREMRILARSIIRENQIIDSHLIRYLNLAYREISRSIIVNRLNAGEPVELVGVTSQTQSFYLPYDFSRVISFFDSNNRSLDILPSEDVRQMNEYNALGTFVQFYEYKSANISPLYDSYAATVTCGISNRGTTVTASSAVFTDAHIGEWLLPIANNSTAGAGNPEDYAYLISDTAGTTAAPSTTCTLARPFRGVISDSGTVSDLTTGYFEIRPRNTPIIKIWGTNSDTAPTIYCEYQRVPSKLANDEDIMEEPRLAEAVVFKAVLMAGWAFREENVFKMADAKIRESTDAFEKSKNFDMKLIHNFIVGNPMARSHGMISGLRVGGGPGGAGWAYSHGSIRY